MTWWTILGIFGQIKIVQGWIGSEWLNSLRLKCSQKQPIRLQDTNDETSGVVWANHKRTKYKTWMTSTVAENKLVTKTEKRRKK